MAAPILYLSDLFKTNEYPTDLDDEYRYYCDHNCGPALYEDTSIMRGMQVQERVLSLAGLMARRYDYDGAGSADRFAANMQLTAQRNTHPMDMDNTVRVLSALDLRRGPGSFSDYISVPESYRHGVRPLSDFLPAYDDTWDVFRHAPKHDIKLPARRR